MDPLAVDDIFYIQEDNFLFKSRLPDGGDQCINV